MSLCIQLILMKLQVPLPGDGLSKLRGNIFNLIIK
jgi:hypothetical protein